MSKGFWSAFLVSLVVLGGIMTATVALVQPKSAEPSSAESSSYAYHPIGADALTVVVFGVDREGNAAECLLLGFLPEKGQIPLSLLPMETAVTTERGTAAPLQQVYTDHGVTAARKALAQTLGIAIHRYVVINKEAFVSLCSKTGTVTTELLQDVDYQTAERGVHLAAGTQKLDGQGIAELLNQPFSPADIPQRSRAMGSLIAEYLNQNLDAASEDRSQRLFTAAVNVVQTDLSFTDYALRIQALHFVSKLEGVNVAGSLPAEGTAEDSTFVLSQAYLERIQQYF